MISEWYQSLLVTQYQFLTYHLTIFKIGSAPFSNLYDAMHVLNSPPTFLNKYCNGMDAHYPIRHQCAKVVTCKPLDIR